MKVYRKEGLRGAIQERKQRIRREWSRFPHLQRFLQDIYPEKWAAIQQCSKHPLIRESRERPGYYKFQLRSCHRVPYCISCTGLAASRRLKAALDQFWQCTPRGQQPRFIHIVQTAPLTEDGEGWGLRASQDIAKFGTILFSHLEDSYGPGIGALFSYHDFGERFFTKRHPHYDLTLNGWMLQGGQAVHTPIYELRNGGRQRWDQSFARRAMAFDVTAQPGVVELHSPTVGVLDYRRALSYQMRELVDLRKIGDYDREKQLLWWFSYKDHRRTKLSIPQFLGGMHDYQQRLGAWSKGERQALHRRYGHLSDRLRSKTQSIMGGQAPAHRRHCPCSECGDWGAVFLEDLYPMDVERSQILHLAEQRGPWVGEVRNRATGGVLTTS